MNEFITDPDYKIIHGTQEHIISQLIYFLKKGYVPCGGAVCEDYDRYYQTIYYPGLRKLAELP